MGLWATTGFVVPPRREGTSQLESLLIAAASAVFGGFVTYFWGRKHGRERLYYEQCVETSKELRTLLREAQWRFVDASAPSEYDDELDPSREESIEGARESVNELDGYYRDREPWLSYQAKQRIRHLTDQYQERLAELQERLREYDDEDEAVRPLYEWAERAGDEMLRIYEELDKSIS